MNAIECLNEEIKRKNSRLVAGLAPRISELPPIYQAALKIGISKKDILRDFCTKYIDSVAQHVVAIKIENEFFKDKDCFSIYREIALYARLSDLFVIGDLKISGINSNLKAYAYAKALLGGKYPPFDAITINNLGRNVVPFIKTAVKKGQAVFIWTKKASTYETHDRSLLLEPTDFEYELNLGKLLTAKEERYSPVGAVVGATHPKEAEALRKRMPNTMFLVSGGTRCSGYFDEEGLGAIVSSSRGLMYAYKRDAYKDIAENEGWEKATEVAAFDAKEEINQALKRKSK